jgi:hypothetical protein
LLQLKAPSSVTIIRGGFVPKSSVEILVVRPVKLNAPVCRISYSQIAKQDGAMKAKHGDDTSAPEHPQLSKQIQRELGTIILQKKSYDLHYPNHKREIKESQLRRIAKQKLYEQLCSPLPSSEE